MKTVSRTILTILGTLSVALGILGMFLPLLPTTPFLLLAAYLYGRSSQRFHHWLLTNRWCGEYIRNYREGHGMPRMQKLATLLLLWMTMGTTIVFVVDLWWLRLILLGIAVGVTIHLVSLKTYRPERPGQKVMTRIPTAD